MQVVLVKAFHWAERLTILEQAGRWIDALALSLDFFDGSATGAGLSRHMVTRKLELEARMVFLLHRYVDLIFSPALASRSSANREADLRVVAGISIDFCSQLQRLDILYGWCYMCSPLVFTLFMITLINLWTFIYRN